MQISKAAKIILGLLTAWVVITPFIYFVLWFIFIFSLAATPNQAQQNPNFVSLFFFPLLALIICTSFMHIGLQAYYLVHIILNKTGSDVARAIFGVGMILFALLAMPVYYFVYIFPDNPPAWALAVSSSQPSGMNQTGAPPTEPSS